MPTADSGRLICREREVHVVAAWHDALNVCDNDQLVALSSEDVEVGGPRGSGHGASLLRDWVGRAGVQLLAHRVYHRIDMVVVEQRGWWRSLETGLVTPSQDVASVFRVRDGRITSVVR